jgi:hypothetical protein
MRSRRTLTIALASLSGIIAPATAFQEPILLAEWDVGVGVGSPEIFESRWPALVYLSDDSELSAPLFEDLVLEEDFPVTINDTVSSVNDVDFDDFIGLLTDGVNQEIVVAQWTHSGPGAGGGGGNELDLQFLVPRFGSDLVGYTVDHVTQILTVNIESPGSDPFGDGLWTDWSAAGTYEFYGSRVPEPGALILVAAGSFTCMLPLGTTRRNIW